MPIIKSNKTKKPDKIKIFINPDLLTKIKEYCKWASVDSLDDFFTQAVEIVLKKDKDWKIYEKKIKK